MKAEAIDRIEALVHEATPIIRAPDSDVTGRFFTRDEYGTLTEEHADRQPVEVEAFSTQALADLIANELTTRGLEPQDVRVFAGSASIVAMFDIDSLRWRHELRLRPHPAFRVMERMTKTEVFSQRTLIRTLRAELGGFADDQVVETFRRLRLKVDDESEAVIAQGRAGVDRRIQQEVTAQGNGIPDEIEIAVPVFDVDEVRDDTMPITLLIDAVPDQGSVRFDVTTVPNDLAHARREVSNRLVGSLRESLEAHDLGGVPVFDAEVF